MNDAKAVFDAGRHRPVPVSSLELAASVYYDIDTGTANSPPTSASAGGCRTSPWKLTVPDLPPISVVVGDSLWTFAFQGAAGIGYAVTEQMTCFLGYRLTGTFEGEFSKDKTILLTALIHNVEAGSASASESTAARARAETPAGR